MESEPFDVGDACICGGVLTLVPADAPTRAAASDTGMTPARGRTRLLDRTTGKDVGDDNGIPISKITDCGNGALAINERPGCNHGVMCYVDTDGIYWCLSCGAAFRPNTAST